MDESGQRPVLSQSHPYARSMQYHNGVMNYAPPVQSETYVTPYKGSVHTNPVLPVHRNMSPCSLEQHTTTGVATPASSAVEPATSEQRLLADEEKSSMQILPCVANNEPGIVTSSSVQTSVSCSNSAQQGCMQSTTVSVSLAGVVDQPVQNTTAGDAVYSAASHLQSSAEIVDSKAHATVCSEEKVDSLCKENSDASTMSDSTVSVKVEPKPENTETDCCETNADKVKVSEMKVEVKTENEVFEAVDKKIKPEVLSSEESRECKDEQRPSSVVQQIDDKPAAECDQKQESCKKVWRREELIEAFLPIWQKIYFQEPEGILFRLPVDPVALGVPDYFNIIKYPMDLSLMKKKLDEGLYTDPWEFVDDMWLMFNNAWLYNRKTSKVYKFCTKLAELFEADIDDAMQSLGYCCGRKYVFSPQVLCCFGKGLCPIPRDNVYYIYDNRFIYCEKCFNEVLDDDIELNDDPVQPGLKVKKEQFVKQKNDKLEFEQFVVCNDCGRQLHQICALYMSEIWPDEFVCNECLQAKSTTRKENKYTAKRLPTTKLSNYLENRVNNMLNCRNAGAGHVTIRVLSSYDKTLDLKPAMKAKFGDTGKMATTFPYRAKTIFAFEEIDGTEVCFFGMHVQEYGSDCPSPNSRRVYIAYLDSVHFFKPRQFRTEVYHDLLIGYLDYVKSIGYAWAHIWACPPCEGDDYIFHCHPQEQKIPKPKRLQDWYRKMLDKALLEKAIYDYKDIMKDAMDSGIKSVTQIPYFEGDFWPNVLEDCAKELDRDEEQEKLCQESLLYADTEDSCSSIPCNESLGKSTNGKKKGQKTGNSKKKNSKTKNHSLRRSSKGGHGNSDLSAKLFATMEKHKEVFFVVRLHIPSKLADLPPVNDPDALIANDLMDGRDAFLMMARDKHYEFSSLRRAKFSSMAMLFELHTQARDSFVYTCNSCHANVDTRYHCSTCDDFDLCVPCYNKLGHPHKMDRLGFDLDDGTGNLGASTSVAASGGEMKASVEDKSSAVNAQEARRRSIQTCLQSLVHACHCRDANCRLITCQKMKRLIQHSNACRRKNAGGCPVCKQLIALCCYHAKSCDVPKCPVPFCCAIKEKLERQRAEQRLKQVQLMRRRMALMQRGMAVETGTAVNPTTSPMVAPATKPVYLRDKNAQFVGSGHAMPGPVATGHCHRNVQPSSYATSYNRSVPSQFGSNMPLAVYDRQQYGHTAKIDNMSACPMTLPRPALNRTLVHNGLEYMASTAELGAANRYEPSKPMALARHPSMTNAMPNCPPAAFYRPHHRVPLQQGSIGSSLPVPRPGMSAYSTTMRPRVPTAGVPVLNTVNVSQAGVAVSGLAERVVDKSSHSDNTNDIQAGKPAAMCTQAWQQSRQFNPHQQNCRLQPMPAYMAQQPQMHVHPSVSGCGTGQGWSRFNMQSSFQQAERLPQHYDMCQQQPQPHLMSGTSMMNQRLPMYRNVVNARVRPEVMLRPSWQQQQHPMHFQPMARYVQPTVVTESVAGSICGMPVSSTPAVISSGI